MPDNGSSAKLTHAEILGFSDMALYELRSLMARRPARIFDGAVLAIVTLAALFCCYEVEVFPTDSKPYTLELDELLLVSTIFCGGLFICALRRLAELQRGINGIAAKPTSGEGRERVPPFLFDKSKAKCKAATIEAGPTPAGRPSKNAEIEAAIDALTPEGVDVSKLPRKDAYARIRQKAAKLGANVEVGFSVPVIQRVLVRRYGPRA
jgi:hypothetical protein